MQIAASEGSLSSGVEYVTDRFNRRAAGNPDDFRGIYAESMRASHMVVLGKYLNAQALSVPAGESTVSIAYRHLIVLVASFTLIFLYRHRGRLRAHPPSPGFALVMTTWYSLAAPLSWFIIFKPTSYIHTFLFPMAWQMPFTLLGFALCGFVIRDLANSSRTLPT
jgi:hypothetical protein